MPEQSASQHAVPNATGMLPCVITNGGSQPRLYDFDDMVMRLVKWHPSSHGLTSTYSELIASRLGQLINAPIARGLIVYVEMDLVPEELRQRVCQPFHVGFTYLAGDNFTDKDFESIHNSSALSTAIVHLAWLQVGDQEGHNQYLYQLEQVLPDKTTRKMKQFMLIDQACLFSQHDWTNSPLDHPESPYSVPSRLRTRVAFKSVEQAIELACSLEEATIRSCFDQYPDTWALNPDAASRAADYLVKRRSHLPDILRVTLSA